MESLLKQVYIDLWLVAPETCAPNPRITLGYLMWTDNIVCYAIVVVLVSLVTIEIKLLGGL